MGEPTSGRGTSRYTLHDEFAAGGMATVHFGFLVAEEGFARPVAIKRVRPHVADERDVAATFLDEARLAARVRHPNVVQTLDVVTDGEQRLVVMEYVAGEALATLLRASAERKVPIAPDVVAAIFVGLLDGLHAAHEATSERGERLDLVHRDVSPQNVLVGIDGITRVLDFGIAKAEGRLRTTREGQVKGKLAYMSPEQLNGTVARTSDIYSAAVCMWEALTLRRLFSGEQTSAVTAKILAGLVPRPSEHASVPPELEAIVMRALHRERAERYPTADAMARAIEEAVRPALPSVVGKWVSELAGARIDARSARIAELERERVLSSASASASASGPAPAASAPVMSRKGKKGKGKALVAGALLLVLGVGIATAAALTRPKAPSELAITTAIATPIATEASPIADSAEPPAPPVSLAPTAPGSTARAWKKPIARPPAARPRTDCDPPYTVDADGVRQYKKACFN